MAWKPGQNIKNGIPTLRTDQESTNGKVVPGYSANPKNQPYGILFAGRGDPRSLGNAANAAGWLASQTAQRIKSGNTKNNLDAADITDDAARERTLSRLKSQAYDAYGLSQLNPTWTGEYDESGNPVYDQPLFVQNPKKNKFGRATYSRATDENSGDGVLLNPDLDWKDTKPEGNYTLNPDGTRSIGSPNVWSDARMHGSQYRGMSFEDAVKASGLLEQMGYDVDWDDMQSYAKALNDFQINGSQDDWYNWVNELSPYYAGYEDLSWDSDANLFNREAFNDWWDANELTYLDQLLADADTEGLRRLFGDSEITSQELGDYVFSDYSSPEGQRYTIWDDQRGDQALANILGDIYDLEGEIDYNDIFNSGEYGVGTNYDAMMSELGREFGRQMAVNPDFVGLTEKQMQPYIKRYK